MEGESSYFSGWHSAGGVIVLIITLAGSGFFTIIESSMI